MSKVLGRCALAFFLAAGIWGCGDDENTGVKITGPEVAQGPGRLYSIREVAFPANDGIQVNALYGPADSPQARPVLILVHDLGGAKEEWLNSTGLFVELLERGYLVVAIDLRGHGNTPLPNDRQVLLLEDLESSFLDVHAALTWLQDQPGADRSRVGVIGSGSGGNVAFVSMGAFPRQLKTGVSLSPGLWERNTLQPLVVGAGLNPFGPRSILFMVGGQDRLTGQNISLSYEDFARNLAAATADPKDLRVFQNSDDHGIELINNIPEAMDLLFLWLENTL